MMRPVSEVQGRETRIIKLATELYSSQTDLDEAVVDAEFLFRFDSACCKWVDNIRGMMWAMIGQVNKRPLPSEEGERLYLHLLENNPDVSVRVQLKQNRQVLTISTAKGDYRCFAQRLREELEQALGRLGKIQNNVAEFETLQQQIWMEANATAKIQSELERLAVAYRIIPPLGEEDKYPPSYIQQQFQRLVAWVISSEFVPSFIGSATILLESKTVEKVKRILRPHPRSIDDPSGVLLKTRIRTWTVYYLTNRGGGKRTEISAVDLWNDTFSDTLDLRNYRSERDRLLKQGNKKGKN